MAQLKCPHCGNFKIQAENVGGCFTNLVGGALIVLAILILYVGTSFSATGKINVSEIALPCIFVFLVFIFAKLRKTTYLCQICGTRWKS